MDGLYWKDLLLVFRPVDVSVDKYFPTGRQIAIEFDSHVVRMRYNYVDICGKLYKCMISL